MSPVPLHRKAQHKKNADIHQYLERYLNSRFHCSSHPRPYIPLTAWLLGRALLYLKYVKVMHTLEVSYLGVQ
jgi:hypothetical protein